MTGCCLPAGTSPSVHGHCYDESFVVGLVIGGSKQLAGLHGGGESGDILHQALIFQSYIPIDG